MEIFRWPRMYVRFRFLLRSGDARGGGEEEGFMTICGYRFLFCNEGPFLRVLPCRRPPSSSRVTRKVGECEVLYLTTM